MAGFDIPRFILGFDSPEVCLESAGGKGAGLARLVRAGNPVPDGFIVAADAYAAFVGRNGLEARIGEIVASHRLDDPEDLERCSREVRLLFAPGDLPAGLNDQIRRAFRDMGEPPVAVRSSATAEDLPETSFAGQQETYLNVIGERALERALRDCWSSLWTARAIGYRARRGIPQEGLALAVVVQRMVQSEASGVMFTANPVTGLRREVVIDASLGLGEALVSGRVEPDHYVVDAAAGQVTGKRLGAKAAAVRSRPQGGVAEMPEAAPGVQALPDERIRELAGMGKRVEAEMGLPQDIEWAWADGRLFLLQSRPISSLYPVPDPVRGKPPRAWLSFAAVQGLLEPMTPLGRDFLRLLFAMAARLFGVRRSPATLSVLVSAGERLWIDVTGLLRNPVGRRAARGGLSLVEPGIRQALDAVRDEPPFQPEGRGLGPRAARRLKRFLPRLALNIALNLISPRRRRRLIVENGERVLEDLRGMAAARGGDIWTRLARQADLLPALAAVDLPRTLLLFISGVASGMASFTFLNRLASSVTFNRAAAGPGWSDLALEVTRGMPRNPTTEMDLSLWEAARRIKADPDSLAAFQARSSPQIASLFLEQGLPSAAQEAIGSFMETYGDRGLAELDLGRPRWREDPVHVVQFISNYLLIEDPALAPDAVFRRGAERARQAVQRIVDGLRKTRRGRLRARAARWLAGRARALMGLREAPKFFAVRAIGILRQGILESGEELRRSGEIREADDLLYLTLSELRGFARRELRDWSALIAARRAAVERERGRRQVPRLMLSDGRCFYEGMAGGEGEIIGAPVSPGVVEAAVRVVTSPRGARLLPGEIMVCPGTDPSWTPLFLSAGGLVMEVGGMMTHGAVVAREYGIPAVVGVHEACSRLTTGQRIRLDGSTGRIMVL